METETFRVEIEGIDGVNRIYSVNCDDLLKIIAKNINYRLIIS